MLPWYYPLSLGEGRVRVWRFDETCDPHPALPRRPLPEGEDLYTSSLCSIRVPFHRSSCQLRMTLPLLPERIT